MVVETFTQLEFKHLSGHDLVRQREVEVTTERTWKSHDVLTPKDKAAQLHQQLIEDEAGWCENGHGVIVPPVVSGSSYAVSLCLAGYCKPTTRSSTKKIDAKHVVAEA